MRAAEAVRVFTGALSLVHFCIAGRKERERESARARESEREREKARGRERKRERERGRGAGEWERENLAQRPPEAIQDLERGCSLSHSINTISRQRKTPRAETLSNDSLILDLALGAPEAIECLAGALSRTLLHRGQEVGVLERHELLPARRVIETCP